MKDDRTSDSRAMGRRFAVGSGGAKVKSTLREYVEAIGVAIVLSFASLMALGWWGVIWQDPRQPKKSLFDDVMPVGEQVPFTTGRPESDAPEGS